MTILNYYSGLELDITGEHVEWERGRYGQLLQLCGVRCCNMWQVQDSGGVAARGGG